ncbi:MAG: hypothetical protein L3J39_18355 [Verrucomicrobiales bacterium]|nr:hypothetical protein [Verrucomicrobiales bacterium]
MSKGPHLIIVWVITVVISIGFFRFGLSDWVNFPRSLPEYIEHNQMRPVFRVVFGTFMGIFCIGTALVVTFRRR